MPEQPISFRDFGILPAELAPPPAQVRSFLSPGRIFGQFLGSAIVAAFAAGFMLLFLLTMPPALGLLGAAAALAAGAAVLYLACRNDYRWVELEGETLRAKHLYTGIVVERSVREIECLGTMVYLTTSLETAVIEKLLGRVKGIEIRFRDGRTPLRVLRSDPAMTNAKELIEAVLYRMATVGELDGEVINFEGAPLVRVIHWNGETPSDPPKKTLKVILVCLIGLALLFGAILAFAGMQQRELHVLGSVPPQEITTAELLANGPGTNRHVTLTEFQPGGYAVQSKNGKWSQVWIALFPPGAAAGDIQVVLSMKGVSSEAELEQLLAAGRINAICSAKLRTSWGTKLGPEIEAANPGSTLTAAWSLEELREVPSAGLVTSLLAGSGGCFVAVLLLALVVWWKG